MAPPHSFIHVNDFENAQKLAEYLHYLDRFLTLDDLKIVQIFVDHLIILVLKKNNQSLLVHVQYCRIREKPKITKQKMKIFRIKFQENELDFSFVN